MTPSRISLSKLRKKYADDSDVLLLIDFVRQALDEISNYEDNGDHIADEFCDMSKQFKP